MGQLNIEVSKQTPGMEAAEASSRHQANAQQEEDNAGARYSQFSKLKLARGIAQGKTYAEAYNDIQVGGASKYIEFPQL